MPKSSVKVPVEQGAQRYQYDLSHFTAKVGAIGSLQTLSCIPVLPGDTFNFDGKFVFRLSPLRRYMYLDCVVDLFAFYVPHRHIYGSNWTDFIKAGHDEGVTLGTDTLTGTAVLQSCGFITGASDTLPRWLTRGYVQIWNRYFRDPSDTAGTLAENYFTGLAAGSAALDFGINCCHLKRIWNTGVPTTLTTGDYSLPLSGGEVNLYELEALKGRLNTEQARDYFATRYTDILNHTWGSNVNIDADQRPELVAHQRQWLSGIDINGTDDATLGTFTGKSAGVCELKFPPKFFNEHGTLWIMGLLRFPPVIHTETHYLMKKPEPTYSQISGDPDIIRRSGPVALTGADLFSGSSGTGVAIGSVPYGQWYREHMSLMHNYFTSAAGHPFLNIYPASSRNDLIYITDTMYDGMFASLMLKHWNCQGFIDLTAKRFIPPAESSIFAGSN